MEADIPMNDACRLCLRGDGKISVFENEFKSTITSEKVYNCVSVKITKNDKLPTGICESCVEFVENWCSFKNTCDETQGILQRRFVQDNLDEKISSGLVEDVNSSFNKYPTSNEPSATHKPDVLLHPTSINSLYKNSSVEDLQEARNDLNPMDRDECLPSSIVIEDKEELPPKPCSSLDSSSTSQIREPMDTSEFSDSGQGVINVDISNAVVNSGEDARTPENEVDKISNCVYNSVEDVNISEVVSVAPNENCGVKENSDNFKVNNVENDSNSVTDPTKSISDLTEPEKNKTEKDERDSVELLNEIKDKCETVNKNTVISVDSDKENSIPNSSSENSNKTDDISEKGTTSAEPEEEDQLVEFTTAVTIDVNPFPDGSCVDNQDTIQRCNSKSDSTLDTDSQLCSKTTELLSGQEKQDLSSTEKESEMREVVSSSVSPLDEKEGEVSSSVEKQCPSLTGAQNSEEAEKSSESNHEQNTESGKEKEPFIPVITTFKEEPIDSTTDDVPAEPLFQLRVKSEFGGFPSEFNNEQFVECGGQFSGNPDDPNNSECFICKRKYSTVSNYKQHLQTKLHLFNSGQLVEPPPSVPKEPPKDIPSSFESPLLRSRLSNDPLNKPSYVEPSYVEQSPPHLPAALPPSPKRRLVDHCNLCNTSFSYVSELRKHLLSKKHRLNVRLSGVRGSQYEQSLIKRMSSQPPLYPPEPRSESPKIQSSNKSIFICPIQNCHFSSAKGESLLYHMKVHGIAQPIEKIDEQVLPKQKLSLRQQDLLKKEEMKMKRDAEMKHQQEQQELIRQQMLGSIGDYECEGCHKRFVRESGLKKHGWYCSALNSEFKQEDDFDLEEEEEEEEVEQEFGHKEDLGESVSHCPLCDISFTARNVFINHVQIYHKGSFLESNLAKNPSSTRNQKLHMKPNLVKAPIFQVPNKMRVTNKTHGFTCDICGKKFNLLSSLNFHLKTHTVSVRHICRICKEPFNNRKAFMEHCRQHFLKPGSKETLCHKCFKVFKTRSELYQHRKNDQCSIKLKIYSCNFCQHSFKDPETLEEHKVRVHSESLDISQDALNESYNELYDDSLLAISSHSLLPQQNDNLPGTSSRIMSGFSKIPAQYKKLASSNIMNFTKSNPSSYNVKNSPNYTPSPPPTQPTLSCNICKTSYSSKQSLKKHTLVFHILNKPYPGSKRYPRDPRKAFSHQGSSQKQWKCKHCKQAFMTRKVLVHHLKKCEYNTIQDTRGMCLQCGNMCESGKTRICQFCLPAIAKEPDFDPNELTKIRRLDQVRPQSSQECISLMKQEFTSSVLQGNLNKEYLGHKSYNINLPSQVQETIKKEETTAEHKEIPVSKGSRSKGPLSINDIHLMKCPVGNKYFRSELTMIKHYSECDGSCENRCSHCRKLFNSPKEYKQHLIYSKCFGPRRVTKKKPKMKYPTFACKKKKVRRDPPASLGTDLKTRINDMDVRPKLFRPSVDRGADDFSDNTMDMSTYSEDTSSIGMESSSSVSNVSKVTEERSIKLGRICTICNKVITMQRAVYRHAYCCIKTILLSQDNVFCPKCNKSFSKLVTMKENASSIKQHILSCQFIPYYIGQGLRADGSRLGTPPQFLCYVCSFGFSSNDDLMLHIKDHRRSKDETNSIVLQLEDELLSDERMANEASMFSLYVSDVKPTDATPVMTGRVLSLADDVNIHQYKSMHPKVFHCDKCTRKFYNRKKYLRHKRVHGIVTEHVLNEAAENFIDLESGNAMLNY